MSVMRQPNCGRGSTLLVLGIEGAESKQDEKGSKVRVGNSTVNSKDMMSSIVFGTRFSFKSFLANLLAYFSVVHVRASISTLAIL